MWKECSEEKSVVRRQKRAFGTSVKKNKWFLLPMVSGGEGRKFIRMLLRASAVAVGQRSKINAGRRRNSPGRRKKGRKVLGSMQSRALCNYPFPPRKKKKEEGRGENLEMR